MGTDVDLEDGRPSILKAAAEATLGADLSTLSIGDLEDRIARLEVELNRCRAAIDAKQGALSDAEAVFKPGAGR